jgi:hypothetical protein
VAELIRCPNPVIPNGVRGVRNPSFLGEGEEGFRASLGMTNCLFFLNLRSYTEFRARQAVNAMSVRPQMSSGFPVAEIDSNNPNFL